MRLFILIICLLSGSNIQSNETLRIITLAPHLAEIVYALGAGDNLLATIDHSDYPEAAKRLPRIGNHHSLNIEAIINYNPDLILAWKGGNPEQQIARLKQLKLKVYESQPQSIQALMKEIQDIAGLLGKTQQAELIVTAMKQQIADLQQPEAEPVRIFYQIWHQPLRTVGSAPWLNDLFTRCGAVNVFKNLPQDFPLVSRELVLQQNPQIILLPSSNRTGELTDFWSQWSEIDAMKNNAIEYLDPDLLHRFTPRATEGLKALCQAIQKHRNGELTK